MSIDKQSIIGNAVAAAFEGLEKRQLMAASWVSNNTLTIQGTAASDNIEVALSNDGSEMWTVINGRTSQRYNAQMIYAINVDASHGNNSVFIDKRIKTNATVNTGSGKDTIYTGAGNDQIRSSGGHDLINAGLGNDTIDAGSNNDKVNGGGGNDYIVAGSGNDSVSADGGTDRLFGRRGNDKLVGDRDDIVDGGAGRDLVTNVSSFPVTNVLPSPRIRQLDLINTASGETLLQNLHDGVTLNLAQLPSTFTIVARTGRDVESVYYSMNDGSVERVDSSSSLSMTYVNNGKPTAWSPRAGSYTLTATPFAADSGRGFIGIPVVLHFNVIAGTTSGGTGGTSGNGGANDNLAPVISLVAASSTIQAGQTLHLDATRTTVPGYQIEDARFSWDFGDAGSAHNTLAGFNSAHVYERPGTYNVRLTVTAPGGRVSTSTTTVTVTAPTISKTIYVSSAGSDTNNGLATGSSVRTLGRAVQLAGNDSQILVKKGDTLYVNSTITVSGKNIRFGAYGSGNAPRIIWNGIRSGRPEVFFVTSTAENVTFRGFTFDSIYSGDTEQTGMVVIFHVGGKNTTIRENTFLNVGYAMNLNLQPTQFLAQDNIAPSETGIRDYFCWVEGRDIVIVGNEVANSTREHIVRVWGAERVLIAENSLSNLDRRTLGDSRDTAKGSIVSQKGMYSYISNNEMRGSAGVGPLGETDGLNEKWARFKHSAIEGNVLHDASFFLQHGAENVTIRDNTFLADDMPQIAVKAYNTTYQRGVVDLVIDHNVGINNGTTGNFLKLDGMSESITLTNNVYVAPYLQPGTFGTAAVSVSMADLSAFRRITGNIWPATGRGYLNTTMMYVGTAYTAANHYDPTRWNSQSVVGDDQFIDVRIDGVSTLTNSMLVRA
jgi:hypothetical protein